MLSGNRHDDCCHQEYRSTTSTSKTDPRSVFVLFSNCTNEMMDWWWRLNYEHFGELT